MLGDRLVDSKCDSADCTSNVSSLFLFCATVFYYSWRVFTRIALISAYAHTFMQKIKKL